MGVCYIQKNFKRKEVKTSPTPQQRVKPTNLRIFVGFYERSNKRNLFNVTLGHLHIPSPNRLPSGLPLPCPMQWTRYLVSFR